MNQSLITDAKQRERGLPEVRYEVIDATGGHPDIPPLYVRRTCWRQTAHGTLVNGSHAVTSSVADLCYHETPEAAIRAFVEERREAHAQALTALRHAESNLTQALRFAEQAGVEPVADVPPREEHVCEK